ncbi:MAG: glycosyl transferase [Sphingobacteriaceae bacterium]|nr:glycosyl transferase [Sphingobacteriaceae bacterium]
MAKILHIITGLNQGGAESVLVRLLENYTVNDEFHVISLLGEGFFSTRVSKVTPHIYHLSFRNFFRSVQSVIKLIRLLRQINPDIVQTWMYHADLLGGILTKIFTDARVIWNIRNGNVEPDTLSGRTRLVIRLCSLFSYYIPSTIICSSFFAASSHKTVGYDKSKLIVIGNGIDTSVFAIKNTKPAISQKLSLPSSSILLGNISRWHPVKDHYTLLKAFANVLNDRKDVFLLLVGSGLIPGNKQLEIWIDRLNIRNNICLCGPYDDVVEIYNAIDIHVLSSIGESFPNVVIEAMSCGVQNVVTDVGDAKRIVGDVKFVSAPGNDELLGRAILNAIEYIEANARTYRQVNRNHVIESFTIEAMCESYRKLWHKKGDLNEAHPN